METQMKTEQPLKRLREARGFTQEELANDAGVSRSTIQKLERGEEPLRPNIFLRKIADALGVTIDELRDEPGSTLIAGSERAGITSAPVDRERVRQFLIEESERTGLSVEDIALEMMRDK